MSAEAIIFDFDGVIVDSEVIANRALAEILTRFDSPTTLEDALRRYSGRRWSDCMPLVEEQLGRTVDSDAFIALVDEATERLTDQLAAIDGVGSFVAGQTHRKLAIASSSGLDWLDACLRRFALDAHFEGQVYSAEGIERGKPHPDIYLVVADKLGVSPKRAVVIEDSPLGVAAGAAAGMTVIGLLSGSHIRPGHDARLRSAGAHHIAADYSEVERIVAALDS